MICSRRRHLILGRCNKIQWRDAEFREIRMGKQDAAFHKGEHWREAPALHESSTGASSEVEIVIILSILTAERPEAPGPAPSPQACARACGPPPRYPATPARACSAMGLPRPGRPLLLLALLLAAAPCPGRPGGLCPLPCRCRGRLLDCSHAALPGVPPATRRRALSIL